MYTQTKTHHIARITITDHTGTHDAGEIYIHKSRSCANCCHDASRDADWIADYGIEQNGRCMNLCSAAYFKEVEHRWCDAHQSLAEFDAFVHRPHRPILTLVATGNAP